MIIELQTNDPERALRLSSIVRTDSGFDFAYVCRISVRSLGFSCDDITFTFGHLELLQFSKTLKEFAAFRDLDALAKLSYRFEDSFVALSMNARGHLRLTGLIETRGEFVQRFEFGFRTDQTVLAPFIHNCDELISGNSTRNESRVVHTS
jgi:hypothetical protein